MYQFSSVRKSLNNKHEKEKNEKEKAVIDLPAEAILIVAKNGITEMIEKIIEIYPVAMYDVDKDQKEKSDEEVFTKNHEDLVKEGRDWLISTSDAYSIVAGLFVSITFSMATALPDGIEGNKHGSNKICVFHLVFGGLPAGNIVFYGSVSALLSFGLGYLEEGATT
uniref:Uncharacterized protein n=1 Tax=Quercus lobata TaxID=97700 RepID=A0A7N2N6N2_QUELO